MSPQPMPIAITGASGELGGRVARLLEGKAPLLLPGRTPQQLPRLEGATPRGPAEYGDFTAMREALSGASTLVLISGHLSGRRLEEHSTAISAAREAGVDRVVYVSLVGSSPTATYRNARDHWLTEQYLRSQPDLRHTIVRAGLYAATAAQLADTDYVLRGPAGRGSAAFVTHGDLAEVIATIAAADTTRYDGQILEVTGPRALSLTDITAMMAQTTHKPYRYEPQSLPDAFTSLWRRGLSGADIEGWISWFGSIAIDELARPTDVVEAVTGRQATSIGDVTDWPAPGRLI